MAHNMKNHTTKFGPQRMLLSMLDIAGALRCSVAGVRKWLLDYHLKVPHKRPIQFSHGGGAARAFFRVDEVIVQIRASRKRWMPDR